MKFSFLVLLFLNFFNFHAKTVSSKNLSESESNNSSKYISEKFFSLLPIFPTFSEKIKNEKCRSDSRIFREQLLQSRLWAVKMFDASSKFPDGLVAGNAYQAGNFDECLSIAVSLPDENRKLKGQYCFADIEFLPNYPNLNRVYDSNEDNLFNTSVWDYIKSFNLDRRKKRRDKFYWALCIPESCGPEDLKIALEESLKSSKNFFKTDVSVRVEEKFCQVKQEFFDFSWIGPAHIVLIGIVSIFVILAAASTIYEFKPKNKVSERLHKFLGCFSPRTNFKDFLKVDENKDILPIHTIRFFSMISVIVIHRFYGSTIGMNSNPDLIESMHENSLILGNSMGPVLLSVDTFFLLGGFLAAYKFLGDFNSKKFNFFRSYLHRYIRLTPVYMLLVAFYATFFDQIGSGPGWKMKIAIEKDRCLKNWWTNLFYINNYLKIDEICMTQTYYLSCDFHYYLITPLIVYFLWKKVMLGFVVIFGLLIAGIAILFLLTFVNYLNPTTMPFYRDLINVTLDPTFQITYIPSHARFTPYLIGIVAAYIYRKKKSNFKLSSRQQWCSLGLILVALEIPALIPAVLYQSNYNYDRTEAAFYAAFHRIPWSVGIGGLVFLGATKNAGIIQRFLSWKILTPLSRLSYCVFLSHAAILYGWIGSVRASRHYSVFELIWQLLADFQVSYFVGFILHILFEAPILKLDQNYLTSGKNSKSDIENENKNLEENGQPEFVLSTNHKTLSTTELCQAQER